MVGILAGVSDDWAKGVANIKYSHTLELSPGEYDADSYYGFNLPEDRFNFLRKKIKIFESVN